MEVSKTSNIVTFTTKGQVVIPPKLRKEFEIKVGTRTAAISAPEGIVLKQITREDIRNLRGSLKNKKVWDAFQHGREWEREEPRMFEATAGALYNDNRDHPEHLYFWIPFSVLIVVLPFFVEKPAAQDSSRKNRPARTARGRFDLAAILDCGALNCILAHASVSHPVRGKMK